MLSCVFRRLFSQLGLGTPNLTLSFLSFIPKASGNL
ncbi:aspartyl-tRNA synthetase, putative [Schistosoma mansoni]|nr:aspartyl-tRNA synthetase, putative [Schistosoma mansoni]|eukprot:XP_018644451.1 aspartyl-tRNA synthetase, putative [Schistosoma mansoni]